VPLILIRYFPEQVLEQLTRVYLEDGCLDGDGDGVGETFMNVYCS